MLNKIIYFIFQDGNLGEKLKKKEPFSENTILMYIYEILSGLNYLHNSNPIIVHLDVKPS